MTKRALIAGLAALALVALAGCFRGTPSEDPPIHLNPNMDDQPKYLPQEESRFFYDGATMRPPVEGTVARGDRWDPVLLTGRDAAGEPVASSPVPSSPEVLRRGANRFAIFCTPCHGPGLDGKGVLFTRAQVESADLHEARIIAMPDGQIFDTITNGLGLMPRYDYLLTPEDRWAVIAYLRQQQAAGNGAAGAAEEPPAEEPAAEQAAADATAGGEASS